MIIKQANHSLKYRMDLQHFAEDGFDEPTADPVEDDFILPDDDVAEESTPPEVETEETTQEDTQPEQTEEKPKIKVKYNKEEQELDYDQAVPLIQKGMNYDKLQERVQQLETDPGLAFVKELAEENGMDVPQYLEAVRQHREQERINKLVEQGVSEEVAKEMLENRKFRDEQKQKEKQGQFQAWQNQQIQLFTQAYPDVKGQDIPPSVWQEFQQGKPLLDAYARHENQQLKEQLAVLKKNQENQQKAPVGSLTAHGSKEEAPEDDFMRGFNSI